MQGQRAVSRLEADLYTSLHALLLCCRSTACLCLRGNAGFYTFAEVFPVAVVQCFFFFFPPTVQFPELQRIL